MAFEIEAQIDGDASRRGKAELHAPGAIQKRAAQRAYVPRAERYVRLRAPCVGACRPNSTHPVARHEVRARYRERGETPGDEVRNREIREVKRGGVRSHLARDLPCCERAARS